MQTNKIIITYNANLIENNKVFCDYQNDTINKLVKKISKINTTVDNINIECSIKNDTIKLTKSSIPARLKTNGNFASWIEIKQLINNLKEIYQVKQVNLLFKLNQLDLQTDFIDYPLDDINNFLSNESGIIVKTSF
jgi:predicted enzyme involved in methoxymalonyl-ACP biosynthesis